MSKWTNKKMLMFYIGETYKAKEIPSKNKYTMMEGVGRDGKPMFFFFGEKGGLRIGSTKTASKSTSYTGMVDLDKVSKYLEELGLK